MKRRDLVTGALASSLILPQPSWASNSERDSRITRSRVRFLFQNRWIVPVALLMLTASGPFGWRLNRDFRHYPLETVQLGILSSVFYQTMLHRIVAANLFANVFLFGNILALQPLGNRSLPKMAAVAHQKTEWDISGSARPMGLSRIPTLGELFRHRVGRAYATESELLVLLTPTIIKPPSS